MGLPPDTGARVIPSGPAMVAPSPVVVVTWAVVVVTPVAVVVVAGLAVVVVVPPAEVVVVVPPDRSSIPVAVALDAAEAKLTAPGLLADRSRRLMSGLVEEGRSIRLEVAALRAATTAEDRTSP